jgi:hypothetical protein
MYRLFLPQAHDDDDLVLATMVAEVFESRELHVTWTPSAGPLAAPNVEAALDAPVKPPITEAIGEIVSGLAALLVALFAQKRPTAIDGQYWRATEPKRAPGEANA